MNERRNKTAYLILVLLIFLIVAIIGGLAAVLFNMTATTPSQEISTPTYKTNVIKHTSPVTDTYIELSVEEIEKPREERPTTVATVVPAVCDGYDPQIKRRDAYKHPVTYRAQIQPNHVQFTIYSDNKLNAKGSH